MKSIYNKRNYILVLLFSASILACNGHLTVILQNGQKVETKDKVAITAIKTLNYNKKIWPSVQRSVASAYNNKIIDRKTFDLLAGIDERVVDLQNLLVDSVNVYLTVTNDGEKNEALINMIKYKNELIALAGQVISILKDFGINPTMKGGIMTSVPSWNTPVPYWHASAGPAGVSC